MNQEQKTSSDKSKVNIFLLLKILSTVAIALAFPYAFILIFFILAMSGIWYVTIWGIILIFPILICFIWIKHKRKFLIAFIAYLLCIAILFGTQQGVKIYNQSITIDTAPAINESEYLPFEKKSKIVKIDSKKLCFDNIPMDELPIIDGAAAAFPVYSAFVNAVYPENTKLYEGPFQYNNTVEGYQALAEKNTDIFIGASPSKEQITVAEEFQTTFKSTKIGYEAFVFFVHKSNPVESLTVEQIKDIYAGKITNWSQVGGKDEEIVAFQRNEGSGSQSMLIRFMRDTPLMEPTTQTRIGGMGEIIEDVADYKNKSNSIGFSFRFYVEGIIKNPDIKMISVGGVAPSVENIKNNSYPIIVPLCAVTYEENENPNVQKLIDWMLSSEGQYIIEQTGYVGIN